MTKRKLALFLPSLRGGGAEKVMLILANAFAQRDIQVDLVLVQKVGPYLEQLSDKVNLVDLQARSTIRSLPALLRYLKSAKPGALLSAQGHANLVAVLARKISRHPFRLVIAHHNNVSEAHKNNPTLKSRVVHWLYRWFYPLADQIVAVSQGTAEDLSRFSKIPIHRITPIYNPIDLAEIKRLSLEKSNHPWLNNQKIPLIVSVGRLDHPKDFETIVRAAVLVLQKREIHWLILGDGPDRQRLEALAHSLGLTDEQLQFAGFVQNPFQFLAHAALFVHSSLSESFGNVLVEAMACGAQVVSVDCPTGPAEILENGKWGSLVPVGDAEAMAKAVLNILETPQSDLSLVENRAAHFSLQKSVDSYLEALSAFQGELKK